MEGKKVEKEPLLQYLTQAKHSLVNNEAKSDIHFILGNESCDLDSMISAIALAYFYSNSKYKNSEILVVPVLNMNSQDFPLRTENVYVLKKYGLTAEDLIFRNNLELNTLTKDKHKITLVDHHVLSKKIDSLKDFVVEIFDHRPIDDESRWKRDVSVNIKQVGSCSTLIAAEIFKIPDFSFITSVATLLYEAVIFDTIGLSEESGKVTALDTDICVKLENHLKLTLGNRSVLFEELWAAHNNVKNLTSKQILSRDLKVLDGNITIPGVPMLVFEFLKRPDVETGIKEFYIEHNTSTLVIMGVETSDGFQRDLALYNENLDDPLYILFRNSLVKEENNLQLEKIHVDLENVIYFKQNNAKPSRKQIIPILKKCIKSLKTQST